MPEHRKAKIGDFALVTLTGAYVADPATGELVDFAAPKAALAGRRVTATLDAEASAQLDAIVAEQRLSVSGAVNWAVKASKKPAPVPPPPPPAPVPPPPPPAPVPPPPPAPAPAGPQLALNGDPIALSGDPVAWSGLVGMRADTRRNPNGPR